MKTIFKCNKCGDITDISQCLRCNGKNIPYMSQCEAGHISYDVGIDNCAKCEENSHAKHYLDMFCIRTKIESLYVESHDVDNIHTERIKFWMNGVKYEGSMDTSEDKFELRILGGEIKKKAAKRAVRRFCVQNLIPIRGTRIVEFVQYPETMKKDGKNKGIVYKKPSCKIVLDNGLVFHVSINRSLACFAWLK